MRASLATGAGMALVRACVAAHARDASAALSRDSHCAAECCLLTGARRAVLAASRGRHGGELAAWGHACALAWAWRRALRRGAVEGKSMRATGGRRFRDLFHVASMHVSACIYMNDQNF